MTDELRENIAGGIATTYAACWQCNGIREGGATCKKPHNTCLIWFYAFSGALMALETLGRMQEWKDNAKGKK